MKFLDSFGNTFQKSKIISRAYRAIKEYLIVFKEYPVYSIKDIIDIIYSLLINFYNPFYRATHNAYFRRYDKINYIIDFDYQGHGYGLRRFIGTNQIMLKRLFLKFIKKSSTFIDVGANAGYISALGASLVGKNGQIHSFEPVPPNFKELYKLKAMNKSRNIFLQKFALGDEYLETEISVILSNGIIMPELVPKEYSSEVFQIKVKRLDDYLIERNISNISLIKIDAEGYEFQILRGLEKYFEKHIKRLPPIVTELNPFAFRVTNSSLEDLEKYMKKYSYYAYDVNKLKRFDLNRINRITDVLFIQKVR